jgi:diguanylate cyclase (GGDEF)-like protein
MLYEKTGDIESALKYYKLYIMHNRKQSEERMKQIRDGIELRVKTEYVRMQSEVDFLTGIPNRRKFTQHLEKEWEHAMKNCFPLSLIMIDIDCFKEFNDNYGHPEGDRCLITIAKLMNSLLKSNYLLSRYGGDEFMAILPNTTSEQAKAIAERIRREVIDTKINHSFSTVSDYVTVTQGVATIIPSETSMINDFIRMVDNALYDAKRKGRNTIT